MRPLHFPNSPPSTRRTLRRSPANFNRSALGPHSVLGARIIAGRNNARKVGLITVDGHFDLLMDGGEEAIDFLVKQWDTQLVRFAESVLARKRDERLFEWLDDSGRTYNFPTHFLFSFEARSSLAAACPFRSNNDYHDEQSLTCIYLAGREFGPLVAEPYDPYTEPIDYDAIGTVKTYPFNEPPLSRSAFLFNTGLAAENWQANSLRFSKQRARRRPLLAWELLPGELAAYQRGDFQLALRSFDLVVLRLADLCALFGLPPTNVDPAAVEKCAELLGKGGIGQRGNGALVVTVPAPPHAPAGGCYLGAASAALQPNVQWLPAFWPGGDGGNKVANKQDREPRERDLTAQGHVFAGALSYAMAVDWNDARTAAKLAAGVHVAWWKFPALTASGGAGEDCWDGEPFAALLQHYEQQQLAKLTPAWRPVFHAEAPAGEGAGSKSGGSAAAAATTTNKAGSAAAKSLRARFGRMVRKLQTYSTILSIVNLSIGIGTLRFEVVDLQGAIDSSNEQALKKKLIEKQKERKEIAKLQADFEEDYRKFMKTATDEQKELQKYNLY
ncbi:hypothetical protein B0T24DRAFT_718758 [Lasiosphaeria ovina]|uniref:Uncharacterized protein n=1 Tax=Lasiosphaeria ovina TaxID=92902 RepID=A0AAE0NBC4_9PEZI|nr:hypothetical protein B0T24DRAFT_718758 [Lasiosphaeria ovina]